jgi:hypothetical protein
MIPAAAMSRNSTQRSDRVGQQVDDVEVIDEVVGQFDHGAGKDCFSGHDDLQTDRATSRTSLPPD